MIKVLHYVGKFLETCENWIYPQIVLTPQIEARVICRATVNLEQYPMAQSKLFLNPPPWNSTCGIPRLLNAVAGRLGRPGLIAELAIRKWKPQLIHAHDGGRGVECLRLKRLLNVPLVTSFYGSDAWMLPRKQGWMERYHQLFSCGAVFLVEGPAMRERLIHLGCPPGKVRIHRIAVDLAALPFAPKAVIRPLRIVIVGRFVEKKGVVDGLRACLEARSQGVELKVTVIGDAASNNHHGCQIKQELLKLAQEPELLGHVEFAGFLPLGETREIMRAHQVFLCPSKHATNGDAEGGSPVALTEAMALGLICVGTRHCDIPQVIVHGQTGYLCEEGDIAGMAQILGNLAADSTAAMTLVRQGRKHIEELFSLETQPQKLSDIYGLFVGA
jgi:colanic acid/amylovoran biosynthesis glycosyltransferase